MKHEDTLLTENVTQTQNRFPGHYGSDNDHCRKQNGNNNLNLPAVVIENDFNATTEINTA